MTAPICPAMALAILLCIVPARLVAAPLPATLPRRGLPAMDPQFHTAFRYTTRIGLGPEQGITRRDPSDAIKVGEHYYVWYTRTPRGPSGYDATVWYATSPDGLTWTERAEAVPRGAPGEWDDRSVFTPSILVAKGRYSLLYTAVANPFNDRTHTAIGMAVADSPDGPWRKVRHNPVLSTGKHGTWAAGTKAVATEHGAWDSHRVDDACLLTRDGRYWLYYKGRQMGLAPSHTKLGVAIAAQPEGPYVKHEANPVVRGGHEVLVWPHGEGVASLLTGAGAPSVWYASDGIHFERKSAVRAVPRAPGAYRPDAFTDTKRGQGITWGVSHMTARGQMPWLVRFDCRLVPQAPAP
ncbi:MAG: family 43 glycosylhydrolase [Candidatus Brocadiae bacterium]|nr:family 43 glycosylhydrolase [Candidatus Brocadiia bacterium]